MVQILHTLSAPTFKIMATPHFFTEAVWSASAEGRNFPSLTGHLEVEVAIIGGGITGISAACLLTQAGFRVAVLERNRVGMGTTGSSTGNLYIPTGRLHQIRSKFDVQTMKAVAASRAAAIGFIEERVNQFKLDCGFTRVPWYCFSTKEDAPWNEEITLEYEAAQEAGLQAGNQAPPGFPYRVTTLTSVAQQAQFHPLRYVSQLAAAIESDRCAIYEHTPVLDVEDGKPCRIQTDQGTVHAKKVIKATHSPIGVYMVHSEMEAKREYALAVRVKGNLPGDGIYWHKDENQLYSVRPYRGETGNYLIVLDASQTVGSVKHTENSFMQVEEYLRRHFDVGEVVFTWAAQNYKPDDGLPFIGTSPMERNTYLATGFAADGLVYGTTAALILSDLIQEKENPWAALYDPKRFTPIASAKNFVKTNVHVAKELIKDYLLSSEEKQLLRVPRGEGQIVEINNKKMAVYHDEEGKLHVVSAACTHLGCLVHWNNGEKSWDCPCHGSRFSVDGQVLEGPAIKNLPSGTGS